MEEGPEPQELYEQVEHSHEASEEGEKEKEKEKEYEEKRSFTTRSAVTASILAVCAALASLLAGHTANDAILKQTQATDNWAYYQAKSTKSHIYEGNKEVVQAMATIFDRGAKDAASAEILKKTLGDFDKRLATFDAEKNELQKKAQEIQDDGAKMFAKHERYSLAVMFFQIAIVICSVAILVRSRNLYTGSILCGMAGVAFVIYGFLF